MTPDKPLGRDRLGRLVYEDDVVAIGDIRAVVEGPTKLNFRGWFYCTFEYGWNTYHGASRTNESTVDLSASPKRTNFERYFADLGTERDIWNAYFELFIFGDSTIREFDYGIHPLLFAAWLEAGATV